MSESGTQELLLTIRGAALMTPEPHRKAIFEALDALDRKNNPPEGCTLLAVDTGEGWELEVGYPLGHENEGEAVALLAWPPSWPEQMTSAKLTEFGFEVV